MALHVCVSHCSLAYMYVLYIYQSIYIIGPQNNRMDLQWSVPILAVIIVNVDIDGEPLTGMPLPELFCVVLCTEAVHSHKHT